MSSPPYTPEKYELQSFPGQFAESQIPLSFIGQEVPMDTPNLKHDWQGMPKAKRQRPDRLSSALVLTKALLMPMLAIGYLTFCYVVHYYVVPVRAHGIIDVSPQNLASIKAGVTTISILIITVGLLPLKSLIKELRSEEFFRVISAHPPGVPVSVVNCVSNPTFGTVDGLKAIMHRHCTPFFTAAVLAGFLAVATSSLAPAALTIQTVLFDGDLQAFAVGAVPPQSIYNTSDMILIAGMTQNATVNTGKAASIAYVETSVGVTYGFAPQNASNTTSYIIPTPSELPTTASARWLSDVITITPTCAFVESNLSQPVSFDPNAIGKSNALSINLPDAGIDLVLDGTDVNYFSSINYVQPTSSKMDLTIPVTQLVNHTTNMIPSDGSSVWVITQCVGNCAPTNEASIYIDLSGIPIAQANSPNGTWQLAFLHCQPRPTIATHEVRSDGTGKLSVMPDNGTSFRKQGNLNPPQTGMLLAGALSSYQDIAGPQYAISGLGPQAQVEFIFGKQAVASVNTSAGSGAGTAPTTKLAPQALSNITAMYTTMAQAAAKVYMTGALGTAYVPGRTTTSELVFNSSLPHVIASTVLFGFLSLLVVIAHFRSGKDQPFTLFGVAAALHGSEIPAKYARMKADDGLSDEMLMKSYGNRLVSMARNEDGSLSLRLI